MLQLDFSQDYKVWDNPESVRFQSTRNNPEGNVDFYILDAAIKQQVDHREIAGSEGVYIGKDVHWFLPGILFPGGIVPKAADKITELSTGDVWTILNPTFEDLDQVWDCICRNPIIAYDLRELVDVYGPMNRQDKAAGRIVQWAPKYQGIPAKIHEAEVSIEDRHGGRFRTQRFDCYLYDPLEVIPGEDQIRCRRAGKPSEETFEIESVVDLGNIDRLSHVILVKR